MLWVLGYLAISALVAWGAWEDSQFVSMANKIGGSVLLGICWPLIAVIMCAVFVGEMFETWARRKWKDE